MREPLFVLSERTLVLIDGQSLYACTQILSVNLDYGWIRRFFSERTHLLRIVFYSLVPPDGDDPCPVRPLLDWLAYNGFVVHAKPGRLVGDGSDRRRFKGSFAVDLAVHALEMADRIDHLVLVSGDAYYSPLVATLQRRGVRVSVLSTLKGGGLVSDDLRRQADQFLELADLLSRAGQD